MILLVLLAGRVCFAAAPNVLFIAIDDLNDWEHCLGGHPQVKTPNIDKLAGRGVLFTNAHCQAPLCNPSRTSILTGMRPSTTGVYALDPWFRTGSANKDLVTLPQYFAAHGYATLTTGKIFHDAYPPTEHRTDGSEFGVWGYHGDYGRLPRGQPRGNFPQYGWGPFPGPDQEMSDWKVADWAIEQLKSPPKDKPFFLCVGFRRPHVPIFAPQHWFDLYPDDDTLVMPQVPDDDLLDLPKFAFYQHWKLPEKTLPWLKEHNQWRPIVRAYLAATSFVDSQVGRVIDQLDASKLSENTVIVLWSDHGWHLGEKGMTGKTTLWERSTHVPLIFAGPGVAKGKCDDPAELIDIYPTLIEQCGLPGKDGLEGHSLAPQLKDPSAKIPWPAITTHGQNNHAIRTNEWRYIRYADGSEELYDRREDPNEWHNLAGGGKYASIKSDLAKWIPQKNVPPIPGSVTRLLEIREGGKLYWEGKPIEAGAATIPTPND